MFEELTVEKPNREAIRTALLSNDGDQDQLFALAREKRDRYFSPPGVEVRSVIEISNICKQNCNYCNMVASSKQRKYVITFEDFMDIIGVLHGKGKKVFLLQSGEYRDKNYIDLVSRCVSEAKKKYEDLVFLLCLGNLSYQQYKQLKDAGSDRYILKFETSNPELFKEIKPGSSFSERIECLQMLSDLGFGVGSGNMIGLPGQTIDDLIDDLLYINKLNLTMVSTSVFIPAENSNYAQEPAGDLEISLNYMALMRIFYPGMLIPSTSSLEKVKKGGQYRGLMAGANTVTIHDGTPEELKQYFPIYSTNRITPSERYMKEIVKNASLRWEY